MADKEWLTVPEAVKLTGFHPYYLRELLREGKVNGRKFGTVWQVDKESLVTYKRQGERSEDKRRGPKRETS
jgi:excisionase family DNA binding protein